LVLKPFTDREGNLIELSWPRVKPQVACSDDKIVVVGGTDSHNHDFIEIFDLTSLAKIS
jgi:hypothetical protein